MAKSANAEDTWATVCYYMKMGCGRCAVWVALVICALSVAAGPATEPADYQYDALARQLGDDDFAVRENASAKLIQAGPAAMEALKREAEVGNPEGRSRASILLRRLAVPPFPDVAPPGTVAAESGLHIGVSNGPGGRVADVTFQGRSIHIEQDQDGIKMTVSGYLHGKPATAHYEAADAAALRDISPQAYDQWQRWSANTSVIQPGNILVNGGALVIAPPGDDLAQLAVDLGRQMRQSNFTEPRKAEILAGLQRLSLAKASTDALPAGGDADKRREAYLTACDDFRRQLAMAGLPDPGAALPPPATARLGAVVDNDPRGVLIKALNDGSRGQKLGLTIGDVVHAVNGQPINSVRELRAAVTAQPNLVLSVTRNGQEITLQEQK
jgi:PDZ domain